MARTCIDIAITDFALPIEKDRDSEYVSGVHETLEKYSECIDKIAARNCTMYPDIKNTASRVHDNIALINDALENYFTGKPAQTYSLIKNYIMRYTDSPLFVANINDNYAFRGLAPEKLRPEIYRDSYQTEYESILSREIQFFKARVSDDTFSRKDMLHIPFDMRGKVDNQRFSVAGIPCMYLSTTSWGCWIEMNRPDNRTFQVSAFKIPDDLRILNLCISQDFINGSSNFIEIPDSCTYNPEDYKEYEYLKKALEIFPLVIATSFRIKEDGRKFKSEYVIPQMIMLACCELNIDGTAYFSKRTKDFIAYIKAVNLALLMTPSDSNAKYWKRINDVQVTEPVRFSEFLLLPEQNRTFESSEYQSFVNFMLSKHREYPFTSIDIAQNSIRYTDTAFSAFDEYLLRRDFSIAKLS